MNLVSIIKEHGFSVEDIAKEAGVAASTIRRASCGKTSPSVDTVIKIAHSIKVNPLDLLISFINEDNDENAGA